MKPIFIDSGKGKEKGLTLIEVLITIALIGVLAAITIPIVGSLIEQSRVDAQKGEMLFIADSIEKSIAGMGGLKTVAPDTSFDLGIGALASPVIYPAGDSANFRISTIDPNLSVSITPTRETRLTTFGFGDGTPSNPYTGFCITAWVGNKNLTYTTGGSGVIVVDALTPPCGLIPGPITSPAAPEFSSGEAAAEAARASNVRTPDGNSASVAFTPVPNDAKGGTSGLLQVIEYRATCTSSDGGVTVIKTGVTSPILVEGLDSGKTYECTTAALNNGTDEWSPESEPTTFIMPVAPNTSTLAQGVGSGGQIALTWTPPTDDGGLAITQYAIRFSEDSNGVNSTSRITTGNEIRIPVPTLVNGKLSFTLSNANIAAFNTSNGASNSLLENGKAYYVSVAAINNAGAKITVLSPRLPWAAIPANPTYGVWASATDASTGADTIRTATEPWDIRIGNSTYRGAGADSDYPTNLTIVDGAGKITITWNPPNNGGVPILRYELEYDVSNTFNSGTAGASLGSSFRNNPVSGGQSLEITGLPDSTSYFVRIRSCNAITNMGDNGCSEWQFAQIQAGATLAPPATPPANVEANVDSNGVGTVTWN